MPVAIAAVVLVGGANLAAYAANGHALLLGQANKESKTATVANTGKGAALSLKTSKKSPPLTVTSSKVVKHLNADSVDGAAASALRTTAYVLTDDDTTTHASLRKWSLAGVPAGRYLVSWDVNLAPLATDTSAVCGVTTTDFNRQYAATEATATGSWIATWLTGSTVMKLDPSTQIFFCQAQTGDIRLKTPLTVSFTKVDIAKAKTLPETSRTGRVGGIATR
jgi:hypothetical protein